MSTKSNKSTKTSSRVKINTIILCILGLTFGVMTYMAASQIYQASRNFQPVSDTPGLCFDETKSDGSVIRDNSYICTTEYDENGNALPVTTDNEYALFLYDRLTLSSLIRSNDIIITVITIGSMFTFATLVAAFIYWNHNRA